MSVLTVVARHELLASRRNRAPQLLVVMFVGMVAFSAFIGWMTQHTVSGIYRQVLADGLTTQPNPFLDVAPLFFARNTVIYVVMIGTLMAAALGVQSALRDRKAATADLVLSRPASVRGVLAGRMIGIGGLLAIVVAASTVISWASISAITRAPLGAGDSARLAEFGLLTWVLLVGFAALGVLGGLYVRRETTALLAPFVAWAVIAFVLPQLGTAARPVSLLNPVAAVPQTSGVFHAVSYVTGPLSVTEHFKTASSAILEGSSGGFPVASVAVIAFFAAALCAAVVATSPSRLRGGTSE